MTEENLHDWVEREAVAEAKQQRYKSKHNPDVRLVSSSFNPDYVGDAYTYGQRIKMKPALPSKSELGKIIKHEPRKNFVMANAVQAILDGTFSAQAIDLLGEEPRRVAHVEKRYRDKKDFGKVPGYLRRVQRDMRAEKDAILEVARERARQEEAARGREYELDEEERLKLVEELKAKWDSYNAQYQRQAHVVNLDTVGKIQRKEVLERMLKRIERAIETLERGPVQIFCKPVQ